MQLSNLATIIAVSYVVVLLLKKVQRSFQFVINPKKLVAKKIDKHVSELGFWRGLGNPYKKSAHLRAIGLITSGIYIFLVFIALVFLNDFLTSGYAV